MTAIALAAAAQLARLPLHPPTILPFITHVPFVLLSAYFGGLGPGLLTTLLCTFETIYFAVEPTGSFAMANAINWHGVGAFTATGVLASVLAENLKRSRDRVANAHQKTTSILESISDGFNMLDREWRYTYVNAAAAKMVGKSPGELLGKRLWDLWPQAENSPFETAYRKAVAENVPVNVEAFYPDPLNAWFDVRCYPSPDGSRCSLRTRRSANAPTRHCI